MDLSVNDSGSRFFVPSISYTNAVPYISTRMGRLYLISVSSSTCRQAPQGVTGSSVKPSVLDAAMARVVTALSGYCELA